jgi:hypothetical protein
MSRKSLIMCLAALGAMLLVMVVAIAVLYHDGDRKVAKVETRYELFLAVPSDAVAMACLSHMEDVSLPAFSGFGFLSSLSDAVSQGQFATLSEAPMAVSLHYSGKLSPLYIFDVGAASSVPSSEASELMDFGQRNGLQTSYVDCSSVIEDQELASRSLVLMAETETLLKSSARHLSQSLSVMGNPGFAQAADAASGTDLLFVSYAQAKPIFTTVFNRKYFKEKYGASAYSGVYSAKAAFAGTLAQWSVFSISSEDSAPMVLKGMNLLEGDASDFMSVLAKSSGGISQISSILPSYTYFALSIPFADMTPYVEAYQAYLDSKQALPDYTKIQKNLKSRDKVSPSDFLRRIGVKEVATATFGEPSDIRVVNLMKVSRQDTLMFKGTGVGSFKGYIPEVHEYAFPGHLAAVFGDYFKLDDESHFTYVDGWLITGSYEAVKEFQSGRAGEYTLSQYMADAGKDDLIAREGTLLAAYLNLSQDKGTLAKILNEPLTGLLEGVSEGVEYSPMVLTAYRKRGHVATDIMTCNLTMQRVKAPEYERDTVVVVPEGPFRVKNSGTGRMNLFYQNSNGAICLKEEDGKGIWGVPFGKPLCGTAHTVDYFANGKLQILFGSGSSIYMIDRLGRFVGGFPVDLGKEILLGPDVYDFNGTNAYNIMVLHKDRTIEMYNLKGQKPSSWKGINPGETIKGLPERIEVGGRTYWVVRTSKQTLIYPFVGGEPLTVFTGQQMIMPDSSIDVVDEASVQVQCYDGRAKVVRLK